MKLMKRALALLLCFLMLTNGPLNAYATGGVIDNDVAAETTAPIEPIEVCEECGGSDAHTETCSFNIVSPLTTDTPAVTTGSAINSCAEGEESIFLDFLPDGLVAESESMADTTAVITANPVTLYKSLDNGAEGIEVTVESGTVIDLITKYTFTTDAGELVFYRYDYYGSNEALNDAALSEHSGYVFIYSEDISIENTDQSGDSESEDITAETEKTDTATGVVLSAELPENVTLSVSEKTIEESGLDTTAYPVDGASLFYDVTLYQDNAEYQAENGVTITFPEAAITNSGLAVGDRYKIYHIHDGATDVTGPFKYTGGSISVDFANLSVVGIAEADTATDLVALHGEATMEYLDENIALTINSDSVTFYDGYESNVYTAGITGASGIEVEAFAKVSFADGFVLYQFAYYGDDTDFKTAAGTYQFISADDVTDGKQDEQQSCAICGNVNCTTAHLYCDVCGKFDCGQTHTNENPYKPDTVPVIPANPELTDGADVSIVDAEGNAITETGIQLHEGEKTSFSAWSDLEDNENVTYQWQICYDKENDLWADVKGQTGKGILISPAMVNSVIQSVGSTMVRCEVTSGETVIYSAEMPVTVESSTASASLFSLARAANDAATYADTPELGEYTVVINYVFENNVIVADPYTATLAAGSNFSTTVKNPTVMGYLPYVNGADETSANVELNITNIQADVTYTVTYKPTNVNYTVIHYQQNVNNDNYTIAETETKQGLTKSTVPEVAKDYAGFYALLYERPEIAADGSTVVEIYYDREYYLIIFNLGEGGYGVEPIYARYGAPVEIGTPTRPGYTFEGWSPDVPSIVPVDGGNYTAQWTANDTAKVKVVIWGENPNDEEYSYLTTGELMLTPNSEYTYNGTDQLYLYCDKEAHTHDASCISCGKEEHTQHTEACLGKCIHTEHTLACYSAGNYELVETTKPDQITNYPTNGIYTYTEYRITHYYLYMDGKWYCAGGKWYEGGSDIAEISLNCTHTHTDSCYTCETHAHTTDCYGCGKEEHIHDSNCTGTVAGLDSTLWTFVKSDTITVNPDGSSVINVYYDRTSFTMTFKKTGRNGDTLDTITDKWGADIKERFENISKEHTFLWSERTDGDDPWTSFMDVMPAENRTYYARTTSSTNTQTATYLVQKIGTEAGNVNNYEVLYTVNVNYGSNLSVSEEEFVEIEGFTFNSSLSTKTNSSYDGAKFYYDRHNYNIEFYNPTTLLKTETGVPYQSTLSSYDWTPDASMAPDKYEPGSVEFEGWYLNPECTGDKFDFTTHTMPAGTNDGDTTLTLYAKWTPVMRTVEFYLNKTAMENGTKLYPDQTTPHGSLLKNPVADPENGDYTFVGWFYMDGDEEKAFLFPTMVITKDMKVYGKWSSNVLKEYSVYFKIQGTDIQIADPITGSGLAGVTKTFDAKGGTDLYEGYQEGYFPLVESHSMTLDIENDSNNTFTFWYVQKDAVPYTVYYVAEALKDGEDAADYETITRDGKTYYIIADTYTNSENRKAVVTEKFKQVSGYMPDAYQKRLVVDGTDGAVNEIIFYYSVDSTHAYYKITHYTQNTDGKNWTEYASSQAIGDIGETYTASPLNIDGFTYDSSVEGTVVSGELTADGLELKLYYVRNEYPYEVRYLEQDTGKQLAEPKNGTGLYGEVVSESAIDIANYTAVDPASQTLTIKIEEIQTEAKLNIITFYYEEQQATINYVVVGNGSVAPTSETLKVLSGTAQGSTATADTNYKFAGWYSNEECTDLLSTDTKYVPTKEEDTAWVDGTTYYAKFELDVADLTITKSGDISNYDEGQSFIFRVTGPNGFSLDVVINGTGSVIIKDLPIGTYTVTEITDWSWRYTPDSTDESVTLGNDENKVEFTNRRSFIYWLSGDSFKKNQFTVKTKEN